MVAKLQLRIRCAELKKMDVTSESDAVVQVLLRQRSPTFVEVGRTEIVKNNANPEFQTVITIDHVFHELQELKFLVSDSDGKKMELIGAAEIPVGRMLNLPGNRFVGDIVDPKHQKRHGVIFVTATPFVTEWQRTLEISFRGEKLDKKDFMGKSDPYFVVFRKEEGVVDSHAWTQVYKSETIMNTLDPVWKPMTIVDTELCKGNPNTPLRIEVYDWDKNSDPDLIGVTVTSLGAIMALAQSKGSVELINPKKAEGGNTHHGVKMFAGKYVNSGLLFVSAFTVLPPKPTFIEYLHGGLDLGVVVAVDFTGSNGLPKEPSSLHYVDPSGHGLNQYQSVILSVGNILSCYDTDQQFPAFGFGGTFEGRTSHCFPLNGHTAAPDCKGVTGIMEAYSHAIKSYVLAGPTYLGPIIRAATEVSARPGPPGRLQYTILLIITDGEINDMPETMDAIVTAAGGPMSIIIVGVGKADFASMTRLDGDVQPIVSVRGTPAPRDIVQFVAFRDFNPADPAALAAAVLAEIPDQVVNYFISRKIFPPPMPPAQLPVLAPGAAAAAVPAPAS
eukprot:m.118150 g.118150  ORF g.118150 m.118150 type:complete len:559 (-) comp14504_c2_seq4:66-1742(-)